LFFRLGDFYEMFEEDAKRASPILGLVLTSRQGVPMCGVPYHSASNYISKLLAAGHKVAICEQTGQEDQKSKLFKREVVRLLTPGTLVEGELLDNKNSSYLLSVEIDIVGWGLSYIEVSTGEFFATQNTNDPNFYLLSSLLSRLAPKEIIADLKTREKIQKNKLSPPGSVLTQYFNPANDYPWSSKYIWVNNKIAHKSALNILSYLKETQQGLKSSFEPQFFEPLSKMILDEAAIKTLELVAPEHEGSKSLWNVLDHSKTPMGSRQLKRYLLEPLKDLKEINERQNIVAIIKDDPQIAENLSRILCETPDIERICGRIINLSLSPRDAGAIRKALNQIPKLKVLLGSGGFFGVVGKLIANLEEISPSLNELRDYLHTTLADNPPAKLSDGKVIKSGCNAELDELREIRKNTHSLLIEIEESEREKTRIPSLKVKYNSVFGYYIEVTKTHLSKIPPHYVRKQTLVSAERFITPRLKEVENKILGAEERIQKIEQHIFSEIKEKLLENLKQLRQLSLILAQMDAFYALAESAAKYDYVRPEITTQGEMVIENGRHPVVERILPGGTFVPNDLSIGSQENQIMILTGPNMSGKSVYLRQNALIAIMAQIGSFVPATSARLPILDRIMTRIGAHDHLVRGESTFMVEMKEVSAILSLATDKSLIILDEVGRGTSTFDGISIAWAIIEYLYTHKKGAKVLFATHYFELTELAEIFERIKNFNVAVREWANAEGKNEVVFLHKIVHGSADKSYGIHVAQMAGLPENCTKRAKEILGDLEKKNLIEVKSGKADTVQPLLPLFAANPVMDEIEKTDINSITPLEALSLIEKWKKELKKAESE